MTRIAAREVQADSDLGERLVTRADAPARRSSQPGLDRIFRLASLGSDLLVLIVLLGAWAGWGRVAVANAHPSILEAADDVTLANDDDGVAVFLDRLLSS